MLAVASFLSVVALTQAAVLPASLHGQLRLGARSDSAVSGIFRSGGSSGSAVHFNLSDGGHDTHMTLTRANGDNLLHFKWSQDENGRSQLTEHRVLDQSFQGTPPPKMTAQEKKLESDAFAKLRGTDEYRSLPLLSQELGVRQNVTGQQMKSAFAFHKFALDAEKLHGTLANLRNHEEHQSDRRRLRRFDLNPWGTSNSFDCNSPSGKCSNDLLSYSDNGDCNYRGTPVTPSMYQSGCYGMCGPGCYNCWTYICGDCCVHPGCSQHDGECSNGYGNFDCLTAKGVLWGDGDSQWHNNC